MPKRPRVPKSDVERPAKRRKTRAKAPKKVKSAAIPHHDVVRAIVACEEIATRLMLVEYITLDEILEGVKQKLGRKIARESLRKHLVEEGVYFADPWRDQTKKNPSKAGKDGGSMPARGALGATSDDCAPDTSTEGPGEIIAPNSSGE